METIKSYTDISQSKTLSKILPLESADMWWNFYSVTTDNTTPQIIHIDTPWVGSFNWNNKPDNIPCWSLAALLRLIPNFNMFKRTIECRIETTNHLVDKACEPIDAAFEMVCWLKENNKI